MAHYDKILGYVRVSDPNQGAGNGPERQRSDTVAYIAREGLGDIPFTELFDDGRSAFHGDQFSKGLLGRFERECKEGFHIGSLFIVENLDRLTREGNDRGRDFIRALTDNGVTLHALTGEKFEVGVNPDIGTSVRALIALEMAHEESLKKSQRTKDNWERVYARAKASGKATRKNAAPWLKVDVDYNVTAREDRAALVRRMFELSDSGMGEGAIARLFEKERIPVWETRKKGNARVWQRTHIRKILQNRKVLGEFQPMTKKEGKLVPNGEPWIGHYPQIVPTDLFNRVNANRPARRKASFGGKSVRIVNLFSARIQCDCCGKNYRYSFTAREGTKKRQRNGRLYSYKRDCGVLYCDTAATSKGSKCANVRSWGYLTFEDAVTKAILHLAMDDTAFANRGEVGRVRSLVAERERALEVAEQKAKRLWDAYASSGSENAMKLAEETDGETRELTANLVGLRRQLDEASGRASSAEHLRRVEDIRADLYCEDMEKRVAVRRKVSTAMAALIDTITMNDTLAVVRLRGGAGMLTFDRKGKIVGEIDSLNEFSDFGVATLEAMAKDDASLADYMRRKRATI